MAQWIAYRDWALAQPEVVAATARRGSAVGELADVQKRLSSQGAELGDNRARRMRATTDEERDRVDREYREMGERFDRENGLAKDRSAAGQPSRLDSRPLLRRGLPARIPPKRLRSHAVTEIKM